MKLIQRTTRYYLIFTFFIFAFGAGLFSFLIRIVILDSIDQALLQEEIQMIQNLKYEKELEKLEPTENVTIRRVNLDYTIPERFTTIQLYDENGSLIDFRQLKRVYQKKDSFYEITIRQSLAEAEALMNSIIPLEIGLFLLLLLGVIVMNRFILSKVWQPFYLLLDKLKSYEPQHQASIKYAESSISEFNELSISVEKMTERINSYFLNQKEFNENSSHEMQTPLTIIRNKLELLIQSKDLSEEDMDNIQVMFEAINRLSQLNKGLLLISKIENLQFSELEEINVTEIITKTIDNLQDQIKERELKVFLNIIDPVIINSNRILIEILVSNLISNSIKHNRNTGFIEILVKSNTLNIVNPGKQLIFPIEKIFDRFVKSSDSSNSIGLGLSIVKKICDIFNYEIRYKNELELHKLSIRF